ncbi:N-6 DNA methylase [Candidatus Saccharibacteria bacterium]|nr:N-6 DNA methylase [Candidatus Saccharibacteria bacterium]
MPIKNNSQRKAQKYSLYKNNDTTDEFIKVKHRGKIYTPDYLVEIILDRGDYSGANILRKHVIDNSCGDGQFMIHVVDRYCKEFLKCSNDKEKLKKELEEYVHAIDIEKDELDTCKERCDKVASIHGVENVKWDFINGNTIEIDKYDGKMDFVVGNPPYVRIHNLDENAISVKEHLFCKNGMTDLYILFYEIGIKMLNKTGVLAYITPSSFFTSLAGLEMRQYLSNNNLLVSVCDLKHFQAFNATTYTTIICLKKNNDEKVVDYSEFDAESLSPVEISKLKQDDYLIDDKFYFSDKESLELLKSIINCKTNHDFSVKNGYATLADKIFISNFDFESKYIIPVVKASCAKWTKIFYPYDENGKLYSEDELFKDGNIKAYLSERKEQLIKRANERDSEKYWYAFGRSQAINDTYKDKLALNALVKSTKDIKLVEAKKGTGVYSGLYIVSDTIPIKKIKEAIQNEDFCKYVSLLGKYKSGGYYTYSSKDVAAFINYKLSKEEK